MSPWGAEGAKDTGLGAVVLAAGASTRLGQPKQLVTLLGETLVERAVRVAREAGAQVVFVVVGANYEPIFEILSDQQPLIRVLLNKRWQEGMSTSLALGAIAAERENLASLLVLTCDQVNVTPEHLLELQHSSRREHVVASSYAGRHGVPALFPSFSFPLLQDLTGDQGARELLAQDDVVAVPLPGGEFDIDTPEDLLRLQELTHRTAPSE